MNGAGPCLTGVHEAALEVAAFCDLQGLSTVKSAGRIHRGPNCLYPLDGAPFQLAFIFTNKVGYRTSIALFNFNYLSVCLSVCLSVSLSVCLSVCLSLSLSLPLSLSLSLSLPLSLSLLVLGLFIVIVNVAHFWQIISLAPFCRQLIW